jgi:glycosyltransferase involved in cell wall biosynthesis
VKIAILHPFFVDNGGGERKILLIAKFLKNKGIIPIIYTHRVSKNCFPELQEGIKFRVFKYGNNIFSKIFSMFKLILNVEKCDVIHSQNIPSYFEASIYKIFKNPKVKHIWACNDFPMHYEKGLRDSILLKTKKFAERFILKSIDVIVVNSKFILNAVKKHFNRKSHIIYSGIDVNMFNFNSNLVKKNRCLIAIGRLVKYKRFDFIINLVKSIDDVELIIIGDGPESKYLKNIAGKLLNKKIFFKGRLQQSDIVNELNRANIFLFPSEFEPLGVTLIEAMACGLPAVSFDKGGPKDIIINNENGYLVGSEKEFKEKVIELLNNDSLRNKISSNARSVIVKKFSLDVMCDEYYKLYKKMLEVKK